MKSNTPVQPLVAHDCFGSTVAVLVLSLVAEEDVGGGVVVVFSLVVVENVDARAAVVLSAFVVGTVTAPVVLGSPTTPPHVLGKSPQQSP